MQPQRLYEWLAVTAGVSGPKTTAVLMIALGYRPQYLRSIPNEIIKTAAFLGSDTPAVTANHSGQWHTLVPLGGSSC